jgi:hypothetical protein
MSKEKEAEAKEYSTFDALSHHPFVSSALQYGVRISGAVERLDTVLKANVEYNRLPSKAEHYCLRVARSLVHVLTTCQQLEHSILYFSSFSPTQKMKRVGITRQAHLLCCIEDYIIRTQSLYDRLLKLIDAAFEIYNPSRRISHDLIVGNSHIRHSAIPDLLKALRRVLEPYRHDRNEIVHERRYLEDDIRRLEGYTLLSTSDGPLKGHPGLMDEIRCLTRQVVKDKTKEFSKVNHDSFVALGSVFDHLNKEYEHKREILERLYGNAELALFPGEPSKRN